MVTFYKAQFYDDKGEYIGSKYFSPKENKFIYRKKTFSYDSKCKTYERDDNFFIFFKRRTYHYYLNNPSPIEFEIKKKDYNVINTEQLNVLMETKVIRDINDISKPKLFEKLDAKTIIIGLVVLIIGYYVLKGGKLF